MLLGAASGLALFILIAWCSGPLSDIDWGAFGAYGFCFVFWGAVLGFFL